MKLERRGSTYTLPLSDYTQLRTTVAAAGCFEKTYRAHGTVFLLAVLGLAGCTYLLSATDSLWIQFINACLAAFFTVQLGLLGHELSHRSVFESKQLNRNLALLIWGLGCGLSEGRWFEKHTAHHQSPNHIGHDPDVEIPFIFSHEQAERYTDFYRKHVFPRQHHLFWIGLWFAYLYNILNSMRFICRDFTRRNAVETILIILHFILVISITFWFLPPLTAILFNLTVVLVMGIYIGTIFAPNHKGEDMLSSDQTSNWVHQITLTRNIISNPFILYLCGGTDYQIEHHLFPTMSRFQYPKAQSLVKTFCRQKDIPYHETTWTDSLRQIHVSLRAEAQTWQT